MSKNYFVAKNRQELIEVYREIVLWFKQRQYDVANVESDGIYLIQARKTGTLRTLTGTNLAFKVKIYWSNDFLIENEFIIETSTGKWISNIAGAGFTSMFTGGFTILTGIGGAGWALIVQNELIAYLENTLNYQRIRNTSQTATDSSFSTDYINTTVKTVNKNSGSSSQSSAELSHKEQLLNNIKVELDKIDSAYRNGILTEEELTAKKAALKIQMDDYEIEFAMEEKLEQLQEAFAHGILTESEYETKLGKVQDSIIERVFKNNPNNQKAKTLVKLKQAWENGIISEEEYRSKIDDV